MLTIVCYVAAVFTDRKDQVVYEVPRERVGQIISNVPEEITKTQVFEWLTNDGSLKVVEQKDLKALENNPLKDITSEGKAVKQNKRGRKKAEEVEAEEAEEAKEVQEIEEE